MLAAPSTAETAPTLPDRTVIVWLTIAVLTFAFCLIEHRTTDVIEVSADELAASVAEGDVGRRLAIPTIGLFGALLLLRRKGSRLELRSHLAWLLLGYLSWCGASILWSVDPPLTFRHFTVLLLCSIGALGIARQVTLRDLCLIALGGSVCMIAVALWIEVTQGTFHPFSAEYRFAGGLHPNTQAAYCAMMAMSAACLAFHAKRGNALMWLVALTGAALLVLTKSRTACAAFLVGLLVFGWPFVPGPKRVMIVAGTLVMVCTIALTATLLSPDVAREATNAVLIGRQDEADSLSGRVPLWAAIAPHIWDHPVVGHGYLTFWNPQQIESMSRFFDYAIPDGHCAYLDSLLDLGIVGAALCVMTVLTGVRTLRRRFVAGHDYGYAFLFALLVCRALNGCLESSFSAPTSLPPFLMVCGLLHLGFCPDPDQSPSTAKTALRSERTSGHRSFARVEDPLPQFAPRSTP